MLVPLKQFLCDVCHELIAEPKDGYVLWKRDDHGRPFSFMIIHHVRCDLSDHGQSMELKRFVEEDGLNCLLTFLSPGPVVINCEGKGDGSPPVADMDEFVDLIRRFQIPYYEEARQYFRDVELTKRFSDHSPESPYRMERLQDFLDDVRKDRQK